MKPVLILQNQTSDPPAYLLTWLQAQGVPVQVVDAQLGAPFPPSMRAFSALAVMGGAMSANDPLPSCRQAESLILEAMEFDKPVIGHCLGGQLMARALGARVVRSPAPEIGWQPLTFTGHPAAPEWFGNRTGMRVMHWHYEAFELPKEGVSLARSDACPHQAFSVGSKHLAMQFHIEIDHAKLQIWLREESEAWKAARHQCSTVQSRDEILRDAHALMAEHQAVADGIYRRWMSGVVPADCT